MTKTAGGVRPTPFAVAPAIVGFPVAETASSRASSLPPQANNLRGLAADERINVSAPRLERGALFIREAVFLINADDAGETAAGVIQYFFDDRQIDAQSRQTACACSS